ncbi:hypothetical protein V6N13_142986 [Hibiscus sabdariffa]|uniref:Uncharacterized protein n=1 Tax=Hibiscus sabdariffa TaxID=183260 RepID=A0ABR2FFZ0_9ROSI
MSSNGIVHQVPEASGGDTGLFSHSEESNGPVIETGEVPVVESELVVEARDVEARDSAVEAENIRMSDPVIEAGNDSVLADEAILPDQSHATSHQAIEVVPSADRVGQAVVSERSDAFDTSMLVEAGARNTHAMVTRSKASVFKPKAYHL